MAYRCATTTIEGFVQLLACNYLPHGYWYYVTGWVPPEKDPQQIDEKLIAKYAIDRSRAVRCRRKQLGQANLQYLRHGRLFVLIATQGEHAFFAEEAAGIRDIRRVPLRIAGYAISYRRAGQTVAGQVSASWHTHVEIERARYLEWKALLLDQAVRRSAEALALEFYRFPFEPYARCGGRCLLCYGPSTRSGGGQGSRCFLLRSCLCAGGWSALLPRSQQIPGLDWRKGPGLRFWPSQFRRNKLSKDIRLEPRREKGVDVVCHPGAGYPLHRPPRQESSSIADNWHRLLDALANWFGWLSTVIEHWAKAVIEIPFIWHIVAVIAILPSHPESCSIHWV